MTEDRALVLDSLLSEKVEVPADIDAGSLGDWFNREFVEELLKASLAALGEHLDRPAAHSESEPSQNYPHHDILAAMRTPTRTPAPKIRISFI